MKTSVERLAWALTTCRKIQVRLTPVRCSIITYLSAQRTPVGLASIAEAHGVKHHCDETTVYRTLMLFKDVNLVRVVGTGGKATHYVLNVPDDGSHFIICERCGTIVELDVPTGTREAIRKLAKEHGFSGRHEHLEMQGLCNQCAIAISGSTAISKLLPRNHSTKPHNHSTELVKCEN